MGPPTGREVSVPVANARPIALAADEQHQLKKMAWGHKTEYRLRLRAQIVLHAAQGLANARIAERVETAFDPSADGRREPTAVTPPVHSSSVRGDRGADHYLEALVDPEQVPSSTASRVPACVTSTSEGARMEVRGARVAPMFLRDEEVGSCSSWIVVMPAGNWPPGIGEGGVRVINDDVVRTAHITPDELAEVEAREREVLESRAQRYRSGREPIGLEGRTVLMVDDGVATGSTARAACRIARARGAARIVLAVRRQRHRSPQRRGLGDQHPRRHPAPDPDHRDGGPGPIKVAATGLTSAGDLLFPGSGDTALVALKRQNEVVAVAPGGRTTTLLTAQVGLTDSTALAARGHTVYVDDHACLGGRFVS
ncbi:phosphoribosyltransferase family protein [Streptomyces sp. NPDC088246]|uniref:phosphoribosyltransferase family protein n=1 Tax=Streptomyces sp. NPDC088246 TaxID=3365842 RepID=UPI003812B315